MLANASVLCRFHDNIHDLATFRSVPDGRVLQITSRIVRQSPLLLNLKEHSDVGVDVPLFVPLDALEAWSGCCLVYLSAPEDPSKAISCINDDSLVLGLMVRCLPSC